MLRLSSKCHLSLSASSAWLILLVFTLHLKCPSVCVCVCVCVCVWHRHVVVLFDGHTAALHLPFVRCLQAQWRSPHWFFFFFPVPFYNYVAPLLIRPPPLTLFYPVSLISPPSLFYFSNSPPPPTPDPFLCLTVPMLVISALSPSFFFLPVWSQLLNFLSHLRHFAWFHFTTPPPRRLPVLPVMVVIVFYALVFYFSRSCRFWCPSTSFQQECSLINFFQSSLLFVLSAASLECTPSSP